MKTKHLVPVLVFALLLSGCLPKKANQTNNTKKDQPLTTKLLVNELSLAERPFTVLVPHATNRLFTFVTIGADKAQTASLDLEYQSGDLLKGAKASISSPISNPFVKAIILGSCSTGGKCTFDKDLKSGTAKFKLSFAGQDVIHVLKGDFTFITGQKNLPDGKVIFEPSKSSAKPNLILLNSFGLPKPVDRDLVLYPIVISATDDSAITGSLTVTQTGATSAVIYDGNTYKPLTYTEKDGQLIFNLNHKPWSMKANIVRDDDKGSVESLSLYLLGPIVLLK